MRKKGLGRVSLSRAATEKPEHLVCRPESVEAIRSAEKLDGAPQCYLYIHGITSPILVFHDAKEKAVELFGSAECYRTLNTTQSEKIYVNKSLVVASYFVATGNEPARAKRGERVVRIFLTTGRQFNVLEKVDPLIRSLFSSNIQKFELPKNRPLSKILGKDETNE